MIADCISSVPPEAVTKAAPLAVSVEANTPCPLIVPVEIVAPDASVKVAPVPASVTLPAPSTACVPTVSAAVLPLSSSVPPLSVSVCAWLPAASSLSVSVLAVSDSVSRLPLSVIADCISSVPPFAVTKAAPLAASVDANTPCPLIVPVEIVAPDASVNVAPAPSSFTVLAPIASALVTVRVPAVFSSSVPVEPRNVTAVALLTPSSFRISPLALPTCRVLTLVTVPFSSSVPPLAVIVPVPVAMFAVTFPAPVNVAPAPMVPGSTRLTSRAISPAAARSARGATTTSPVAVRISRTYSGAGPLRPSPRRCPTVKRCTPAWAANVRPLRSTMLPGRRRLLPAARSTKRA